MRRFRIIFLGLLVLMSACDDKNKPEKPKDLISKNKMEVILYDLYILNSAKGINKKILENNNVVPETYILTKHNIDSIQFAESNDYYAFDSDDYKAMIERIKTRLQKEKTEFEELQKTEGQAAKRRRDSINRANSQKRIDSLKKVQRKLPAIN